MGEVSLPWVYVESAIYETYLVQWFSRYIWSIRGGGMVSLPWVYVYTAISESYSVE